MAHFAKIEDGIVTKVIVIPNEHEDNGQEYINSLGLPGVWIQTSYNNHIRGKFAAIGDVYDSVNDEFVERKIKPFTNWVENENGDFEPPFPPPSETGYYWRDETQEWVALTS